MSSSTEGGRVGWMTAFGRSELGRELLRRMPRRIRKRVWATRRWQKRTAADLRSHWHRSLQFRVVATTLLLSVTVIAVLGFFLVQAIANGLQTSAEKSAALTVANAAFQAQAQQNVNVNRKPIAFQDAETTMKAAADAVANTGDAGWFVVRLADRNDVPIKLSLPWIARNDVNLDASIPLGLIHLVDGEQSGAKPGDTVLVQPTTLVPSASTAGPANSGPAAVAALPLGVYYQLYYVLPFTDQQSTLQLVQKVLLGVGVALVALLAAIASLVTRWVVLPVRHAAEAAQRLSAGNLDSRLPVQGRDDLARLATSFNEMAANLQEKLRQLEELSSLQRQFVSDVSHELRTPLTTIRMAATYLGDSKDEMDPATARSVELLQSQIERFEELLVDLLEISRYDAGAATLEAEPVDVCDLVRRSADSAQQLAERRGSRIEFQLPAEGCFAEVDRRRVERILRNILVNAVEHGEGRDVIVTAAADSDAVAVAVRDFGIGLRPGEEQLVFDRFWRADPARARTSGGTGLGLAISLEDARLHGGWLQAWGERGKGAVFRLTLPRRAGQALAGSPLPLEPDDTEMMVSLSGARPFGVLGAGALGPVTITGVSVAAAPEPGEDGSGA